MDWGAVVAENGNRSRFWKSRLSRGGGRVSKGGCAKVGGNRAAFGGGKKVLHDIGNQLMVIQGLAAFVLDAIKKNRAGRGERERMEKIVRASENIAETVRGRRDY